MPVGLRWRNTEKKEKENQGCKQERDKEKTDKIIRLKTMKDIKMTTTNKNNNFF